MRFLREQLFPQTLPSIISVQLPLAIATLLDAADELGSGQGYKTVVSVGSASGKPSEEALQDGGSGFGPDAPLHAVQELLTSCPRSPNQSPEDLHETARGNDSDQQS